MLTVKAVSEMKGIARENVYRAIHDGRLASVLMGGHFFVLKEDAMAWVPSQSHVDRAEGKRTRKAKPND